MTKLLDAAIEAARALPPSYQDDIARIVFHLAGTDDQPPVTLSSAELEAVRAKSPSFVSCSRSL